MNRFYRNNIKLVALLLMAVGTLFVGCTDDDEELGKRKTSTLQLIPAVSVPNVAVVTRAAGDPLPNSWKLYEDIYPLSLDRTVAINIFMVENHKAEGTSDPASVTGTSNNKFTLKKNGNWDSNIRVVDAQKYYIFGFLCDTYSSAKLSLLEGSSTYSDGGKIELNGLGAATAADVSLVVGTRKPAEGESMSDAAVVKGIIEHPAATTEDPQGKDALGKFDYAAATNNNYIYLWLDHLYSCVNFEFEVEDKYSQLREIQMKKVTLTVNGQTYNVTAEVRKDRTPSLLHIISVAEDTTIPAKDFKVTVFDGDATKIPAHSEIGTTDAGGNTIKALSVPGYFAPGSMKEFTAEFEFDVISKGYNYATGKQIITRKSATATNKFPANIFGYDDEATNKVKTLDPGRVYTIKATIAPTYLYQLAEDDLDNPTIHITTP